MKREQRIALIPFERTSLRDEVTEFEHLFVFGIQEFLELIGEESYVDLYPIGGEPKDGVTPKRPQSDAAIREMAREAGASQALTGRITTEGRSRQLLRSLTLSVTLFDVDRPEPVVSFEFTLMNQPSSGEGSGGFRITMDELHDIHRQVFEGMKKALSWRVTRRPDVRKYYRYRLRHPLTPSFDAFRSFVIARRLSGCREEKLVHYKRSSRFDPTLGHAYRNIAYLYKEGKKLASAIHYYQLSIKNLIDPEAMGEAHAELGLCYANLNNIDEAIRQWHLSRRWNPTNKDVFANLAIGYEEKGLTEKAVKYFGRAQRIDPQYYWACRGLGRIYANQRQWKKAIKQLKLQVKIAPEDAWGHYTLGSCYFHEGAVDKAREHLRKAMELDPEGDAGRQAFQGLMQLDAS
ncbi:MAG: tetratricopeptide repeat protein [Planctomycetes bacterium]|nr:tetratricopeptide repeat protein [Planctomycetota bacterium]